LTVALQITDPDERWRAMFRALDMDRFMSFMVMEVLLGHGDGYCLRKNNFRLVETAHQKLAFVPHGMDQLFGRAPSTIYPQMNGLVARAVMAAPQGREAYRQRIALLFTNVFDASALVREVDRRAPMLAKELSRSERHDFEEEISALKQRILERRRLMAERLDADNQVTRNGEKPLTSGRSGFHYR
jgi:hypothetical protein